MLAALSCVDHLVAFDEPTAEHLVDLLRPDVYVKGGATPCTNPCPRRRWSRRTAGRCGSSPTREDRSTTAIVERIRGHAVSMSDVASDDAVTA